MAVGLPIDEANAWLRDHGCAQSLSEPTSLAGLYDLLVGGQLPTTTARRLGFA